jgi:hypothetical protein
VRILEKRDNQIDSQRCIAVLCEVFPLPEIAEKHVLGQNNAGRRFPLSLWDAKAHRAKGMAKIYL